MTGPRSHLILQTILKLATPEHLESLDIPNLSINENAHKVCYVLLYECL